MNKVLLHTPDGVRDIYGRECSDRNIVRDKIHRVIKSYGYQDIDTPTFEFFDVFKGYKLMDNKENGNKRPCYFCFNDPENEKIIWFVPISSKVDKYKTIYENKKKNRKKVYNFVFGKVLGKEKAFLIQNIFPTTEVYIESKYQNDSKDVEIAESLKNEIIKTAMNTIILAKKGVHIPFYNIIEMKNILLKNNGWKERELR